MCGASPLIPLARCYALTLAFAGIYRHSFFTGVTSYLHEACKRISAAVHTQSPMVDGAGSLYSKKGLSARSKGTDMAKNIYSFPL